MTDASLWTALAPVGDHLWQSSLFAGAIGLLTLGLRHHRASVRHTLWVVASIKFLIPFAAIAALGSYVPWTHSVDPPDGATVAFETFSQPFSQPVVTRPATAAKPPLDVMTAITIVFPVAWAGGTVFFLWRWAARWRRISVMARAAVPTGSGREHEILRQLSRAFSDAATIQLRMSDSTMEPGVFGVVRPLLLWPRGMSAHLSDAQIETVLSHELVHVARRDNLFAALQTCVEALFWFHPLVWWIGGRLIEEREHACDETVLARGAQPHVYAESILKTCEYCIEPPVSCVAGVTGANLKKRIGVIMNNRRSRELSPGGRWALIGSLAIAVTAPLGAGMLQAQSATAQRAPGEARPVFAAASARENQSGDARATMQFPPGRFVATNALLRPIIAAAYGFPVFRVTGGPSWLNSSRFDIEATTGTSAQPATPGPPSREAFLMLQSLLEDRFSLVVHEVSEEQPIYRLVRARRDGSLGPRLRASTLDCESLRADRGGQFPGPPDANVMPVDCGAWGTPGSYVAGATTVSQFAGVLANRVNRFVVDESGLEGLFDLHLQYTPDPVVQPNPVGGADRVAPPPDMPSLFSALEEQLGLRLEGGRGSVPVLAVDRVEKPIEK